MSWTGHWENDDLGHGELGLVELPDQTLRGMELHGQREKVSGNEMNVNFNSLPVQAWRAARDSGAGELSSS